MGQTRNMNSTSYSPNSIKDLSRKSSCIENALGEYFSVPSNHESPSTCARLRPETLSPSTLVGLLQHGNVEYDVHGTAVPLAYLDLHSVDIHPEVPQVGDEKKQMRI